MAAFSSLKGNPVLEISRPRVVTLDGEVIAPNGNMSAELGDRSFTSLQPSKLIWGCSCKS